MGKLNTTANESTWTTVDEDGLTVKNILALTAQSVGGFAVLVGVCVLSMQYPVFGFIVAIVAGVGWVVGMIITGEPLGKIHLLATAGMLVGLFGMFGLVNGGLW